MSAHDGDVARATGAPNAPAKSADEPGSLDGLKKRLVGGSVWTLAGYGSNQVLRLASNLVLTRLLVPEAFGLMALVQIVISGVAMFSDVGLRGSVIHDKRGEDPRYLNTAWTMQVIRGAYLWFAVCLIAWPAARFYEQPDLVWLIPVAGLGSLIEGFSSTARYTLLRRVEPGKQIALDVAGRTISIVAMLVIAWLWPSVWALVLGGHFGSVFKTITSHRLIPGYRNRFELDKEAARSMFRFGRWVFVGTALTFVLGQGDRLILGKVFTATEMGVYSIAFFLAQAVVQTGGELSSNVLQPFYARLRAHGHVEFRGRMRKVRIFLLAIFVPLVWILAIFGPDVVRFFYDPRYEEAGWMLRILAIGSIGSVIGVTADRVIIASGDSFGHMMLQVGRAILLVAGMVVGYSLGDVAGLLIGVSAARLVDYSILQHYLRKHGAWLPEVDLAVFAASAVVVPIGIWLRG